MQDLVAQKPYEFANWIDIKLLLWQICELRLVYMLKYCEDKTMEQMATIALQHVVMVSK